MRTDAGPGTAPPEIIYRPPSYVDRLDLGDVFAHTRPLELELGAGDGSFLIAWAAMHPNRNFLGIERLLGRLRKIERKARRAGLTNLRAIRIEAAYFLEYLLPPQSLLGLHVYFPDPWPKRKHKVKRLINAHFTSVAARALAPGGRVYLRTDDADYFRQMQAVFAAHMAFRAAPTPAELANLRTDFERQFEHQGISTLRAAYELVSSAP